MSTHHHTSVPPLTLGWRLQMSLDQAGLKYPALMMRFQVSRGTVSRWCRDIGPRPKQFILEEIAKMCGVDTDWLIGDDEDDGPSNGEQQPPPPSELLFLPPKSNGLSILAARRQAADEFADTAA